LSRTSSDEPGEAGDLRSVEWWPVRRGSTAPRGTILRAGLGVTAGADPGDVVGLDFGRVGADLGATTGTSGHEAQLQAAWS
jgi:hypothetical protein